MSAAIQFQHITKHYPGFVLDDVSMEFGNGSIVGLVGQNGAGKSTFVKCCLGLVHRDAGSILIDGHPLTDEVALRGKIGYLPETLTFYEWMTVKRYLGFIAAFYPGWDVSYQQNLMQRLRLDSTKLIKHLSKGMRAKVALIAALCPRPEILFLDESTSGMDPLMKHEFLEELKALVARGEVRAIIFSSHILAEVVDLCNMVAVVKEGKLVHFDSMEVTLRDDTGRALDEPMQAVLICEASKTKSRFEAALLEKV